MNKYKRIAKTIVPWDKH